MTELSSKPADEIKFVHDELRTAIRHIEHMAAWIGKQNSGYSFEGLGEDMPSIHAALECARTHAQQVNSLHERGALRRLVDIVWNEATESAAVSSTNWADRMIDRAGYVSPQQADAQQVKTVGDDDWRRALDCAWSCMHNRPISKAELDNAMQHAFGLLSLCPSTQKGQEPSTAAMMAAVELEIEAALGKVTTRTIGHIVQRAVDAHLNALPLQEEGK